MLGSVLVPWHIPCPLGCLLSSVFVVHVTWAFLCVTASGFVPWNQLVQTWRKLLPNTQFPNLDCGKSNGQSLSPGEAGIAKQVGICYVPMTMPSVVVLHKCLSKMSGWMNGQMDGQMGGWVDDGWMGGWVDEGEVGQQSEEPEIRVCKAQTLLCFCLLELGRCSIIFETVWVLEVDRPVVKPNPGSFNSFINLRMPPFLTCVLGTMRVPAFCACPKDKKPVYSNCNTVCAHSRCSVKAATRIPC